MVVAYHLSDVESCNAIWGFPRVAKLERKSFYRDLRDLQIHLICKRYFLNFNVTQSIFLAALSIYETRTFPSFPILVQSF